MTPGEQIAIPAGMLTATFLVMIGAYKVADWMSKTAERRARRERRELQRAAEREETKTNERP